MALDSKIWLTGFVLDIFPENTKAGKRLSKGQCLLLIVR
jgi:hypothetical protein